MQTTIITNTMEFKYTSKYSSFEVLYYETTLVPLLANSKIDQDRFCFNTPTDNRLPN